MKKWICWFSFCFCIAASAQDFKKLILQSKAPIPTGASFYLPIIEDQLEVVKTLKAVLPEHGFKIAFHKGEADFVLKLNYTYRLDNVCPGGAIKKLNGIILSKTDQLPVATFSFSQNGFESKCTFEIMNALAQKIQAASP